MRKLPRRAPVSAMLRAGFVACVAAFVAACASTYAPHSITGGFSEQRIAPDVWRVEYNANAYTSEETVQTYWLYRSAEIALEQGYDGFQIVSPGVELISLPTSATQARLQPIVESGIDGKPWMVANIRLLRAPLPEGRYVFDARAMKAFLEPYVTGQLCGGNVCPHVHRYLFPGFTAHVEGTT